MQFGENLSNMANLPYSFEIEKLLIETMAIFERECKTLANQGDHSICTFAKYHDCDYNDINVDFGTWSRCYWLKDIPDSIIESVFLRVQELIRVKLRELGMKDFAVEGVTEGPVYGNRWLFGGRIRVKDKANPRYIKKIKITAEW